MNCSDWEERIALHAGGDLPPAEAAEVERHLRECAGCQVLASGLEQSLALLKEAHNEPLSPAHFPAVRARVVAELEQEQRRGAFWARRRAWGYGLAAVAVALLVMLALRPGRTPAVARTNRSLTVAAPTAPVVATREKIGGGRESAVRPHIRRVARRVVRANVPDTSNPEPLLVKLVTDDPNVVIYWIADRKRGE
jgi:anti-sigma factor RsiW